MATADKLVRDARTAAGLTQAQLAERAGTTQSAIARLERPGANPRLNTLQDVMAAASHRLEISLAPAPSSVDETLITRQLRMTPAERVSAFEVTHADVQRFAAAARDARDERR